MLLEQPTPILSKIYPNGIFRKNPEEHSVYLTFDDGPIPEVTPWVLDILDQYGIKATFLWWAITYASIPTYTRWLWSAVTT